MQAKCAIHRACVRRVRAVPRGKPRRAARARSQRDILGQPCSFRTSVRIQTCLLRAIARANAIRNARTIWSFAPAGRSVPCRGRQPTDESVTILRKDHFYVRSPGRATLSRFRAPEKVNDLTPGQLFRELTPTATRFRPAGPERQFNTARPLSHEAFIMRPPITQTKTTSPGHSRTGRRVKWGWVENWSTCVVLSPASRWSAAARPEQAATMSRSGSSSPWCAAPRGRS